MCRQRRGLRLVRPAPFRTDFAGHACDFGSEGVELVHHRVDGVLELEDLATHVDRYFFRQISRATAVVTSAMFRT